jgi:hypothetical protein
LITRADEMWVLVVFDEAYRIYGEFIASAIRRSRPAVKAQAIDRVAFEGVVYRCEPHLLICSPPVPPNPISTREEAWVELSLDPERPSRVCLGEQRWESLNPSLEDLLSVVDEAEKLGE